MKTGSSLNPYAAAYVPLFKRGPADLTKEFGSPQEFNSGNEAGQKFGYHPVNLFPRGQHPNVYQSHSQSPGAPQTAEYPKWKDNRSSEFFASTSQYPEKQSFDVDSDMDLAYLQMIFPGISDESLSDVYQANRCDLDSAVDMLNQLEVQHDDSTDKLPDTLDIGDVPDSAPVKAPQGAKNATGGASTSALSDLPAKS
ncbi:polyadenylate-binding protein-interacting protein 6-like [Salvia splendens]|uniref:polyadenylate-binding protein-interacting protein 6-like n=1 Tax=Salvia splendens TaxID=180675 RepID=UPI001C26B1E4|nr:polyadenylate-binding protein-interacting protein 6-like [Salvia splendens]